MKTVTKEQVYKALYNNCQKEDILNELFPPEFKAGEWVVGWHNHIHVDDRHKKAWKIYMVKDGSAYMVDSTNTCIENIRHATPEEIEAATWKEGELYRVKKDGGWCVRVASPIVGHFYAYGYYEGRVTPWEDYEKLNTCSCGFCVKEKEG